MKKLSCILFAVLLLSLLAVPSLAGPRDFTDAFFPDGKIEAPEKVPYFGVRETNEEGGPIPTEIDLYIPVTEQLHKLGQAISEDEDLQDRYGIADLDVFTQIDVRFDDGPWLSSGGNWDAREYIDDYDGGDAQLIFEYWMFRDGSGSESVVKCEQSRLAYHDEDNFVSPYVEPYESGEDTGWQFRLGAHTMTYRYRYYVRFIDPEADGSETVLISGWSPDVSIGKNGTAADVESAQTEAPVLSKFSIEVNSENETHASYFLFLPESIDRNIVYADIHEGERDIYQLETQIRVNGGDWFNVETDHYWIPYAGYRFFHDSAVSSVDDQVEMRVRLTTDREFGDSPWSNVIGNVAGDGGEIPTGTAQSETEPAGTTAAPAEPDAEKSGCKLCHICPVQPLGICLFVWIGAAVLVILLIVILASAGKKNKNKKH